MLTPHYGWSMTKSVTNALIGIRVEQGMLDIYAPAPLPLWADPSNPRHTITVDRLLRLSSGLFCLQDGVWEGERILPEGWLAYSTTPTPSEPEEPNGKYGAHFWLNAGGVRYPGLPEDLFECSGHDGQKVTVIPS